MTSASRVRWRARTGVLPIAVNLNNTYFQRAFYLALYRTLYFNDAVWNIQLLFYLVQVVLGLERFRVQSYTRYNYPHSTVFLRWKAVLQVSIIKSNNKAL